MEYEDFKQKIVLALNKKEDITFSCNCQVEYNGRVKSQLLNGDRTILIKSDGGLIIHQPIGNAPINYMKPGTQHEVLLQEDHVRINSKNLQNKDFMSIKLKKVYFLHSKKLEDSQKILLEGSEKDMSDHIMKNPHLISKNFKPVNREEQTKYGYIDVLGMQDGILVIVECKRTNADLGAVTQLRRYVEKIKESKGIKQVKGIIASPRISSNAHEMLKDWGFTHVEVNPPSSFEQYKKTQQTLF